MDNEQIGSFKCCDLLQEFSGGKPNYGHCDGHHTICCVQCGAELGRIRSDHGKPKLIFIGPLDSMNDEKWIPLKKELMKKFPNL